MPGAPESSPPPPVKGKERTEPGEDTMNRRLSSMDSGLEAFSHNPTDGSFAALTFQSTAITNYLNQRFLSY